LRVFNTVERGNDIHGDPPAVLGLPRYPAGAEAYLRPAVPVALRLLHRVPAAIAIDFPADGFDVLEMDVVANQPGPRYLGGLVRAVVENVEVLAAVGEVGVDMVKLEGQR